MKIRSLLVGLLLVASATSALAAGPYIGAAGGVSIMHDSDVSAPGFDGTVLYDTGYGFNVSAGYDLEPVRVEFEFGYKNADIDTVRVDGQGVSVSDSDISVMSYMANAYFDIKTQSAFTPYIGAGLGVVNGEIDIEGDKDDDTVFGYQVIAGVAYNMNKNMAIELSYRFQSSSDLSIDDADVSYMSSNIMAGLRYNF